MLHAFLVCVLSSLGHASLRIPELSDVRSAPNNTDNALLPNLKGSYLNATSNSLTTNLIDGSQRVNHTVYSASQDQTSALQVAGVNLTAVFVQIVKKGYAADAWSSELNGVNAAVRIINSTTQLSYVNITSENGAIGAFASNRSTLNVSQSDVYTSGPVAHGLWSSLGAHVSAERVYVHTNGLRSAAFGVGPQGNLHVVGATAHTSGDDSSPVLMAVGEDGNLVAELVTANADKSPIAIIDGSHHFELADSDVVGAGLAGILVTHSSDVPSHPQITLRNSIARYSGAGPAVWFGNCMATVTMYHTTLSSVSGDGTPGVLLLANASQTTPAYDDFGLTSVRPLAPAAMVTVNMQETSAHGDVYSVDGGTVSLALSAASVWFGSTYTTAMAGQHLYRAGVNVQLSRDSQWIVAGHNAVVGGLYDADPKLANIVSNGFNVSYDANHTMSSRLAGRLYALPGGGYLEPYSEESRRRL